MTTTSRSDVGGHWTIEVREGRTWQPAPGESTGWTLRGARKAATAVRDMYVDDGFARETVEVRARHERTGRKVDL